MGNAGRTVHEPEEEAENPETGKGDRLVKTFADLVKTAGPKGAVMAIYVASQTIRSDDGWVEKSIVEVEKESGLGRRVQDSAIASLVKLGCIAVEAGRGSKRRMKFVGETGFLSDIAVLCGAATSIADGQHGNPHGNVKFVRNEQTSQDEFVRNEQTLSADMTNFVRNVQTLSTGFGGNEQTLSTGHSKFVRNVQTCTDYHDENRQKFVRNVQTCADSDLAVGRGGKGGMGETLSSSSIQGYSVPSEGGKEERLLWERIEKDRGCGGKEGKGKVVVHGFDGGAIEVPPDLFRDAAKTTVQGDLLEPETGAIGDTDQQPAQDQKKPQKPKNGSGSSQENPALKARYFATAKKPADVDQAVWDDFIALRRAKKAPLTETALRMLENEARKAGITTQEAMRMCCANGWQGFKASWMREQKMRETALQERGDRAKGNGKDEDWWSRVL
jgi:hypothetical protein